MASINATRSLTKRRSDYVHSSAAQRLLCPTVRKWKGHNEQWWSSSVPLIADSYPPAAVPLKIASTSALKFVYLERTWCDASCTLCDSKSWSWRCLKVVCRTEADEGRKESKKVSLSRDLPKRKTAAIAARTVTVTAVSRSCRPSKGLSSVPATTTVAFLSLSLSFEFQLELSCSVQHWGGKRTFTGTSITSLENVQECNRDTWTIQRSWRAKEYNHSHQKERAKVLDRNSNDDDKELFLLASVRLLFVCLPTCWTTTANTTSPEAVQFESSVKANFIALCFTSDNYHRRDQLKTQQFGFLPRTSNQKERVPPPPLPVYFPCTFLYRTIWPLPATVYIKRSPLSPFSLTTCSFHPEAEAALEGSGDGLQVVSTTASQAAQLSVHRWGENVRAHLIPLLLLLCGSSQRSPWLVSVSIQRSSLLFLTSSPPRLRLLCRHLLCSLSTS